MYRFELNDLAGNKLANLDKAISRKYSLVLNAAGSISFNYDGKDSKASLIKVGTTEIHIYRDDVKMQAGQVRLISTKADADSNFLNVGVVGFFGLLEHRFLRGDKTYTQIDQGQIAWDLINYTQTILPPVSNLNITQGSIPSSKLRDRTYETGKQIAEAIKQLSEVQEGFDFEITPGKVFNVYYPFKGIYLTNYIFELGKNIREIEEKPSASPGSLANFILAIGKNAAGTQIFATASDSSSLTQYGVREAILSLQDVKEQATLQAHANDFLDRHKQPPTTYELTVEPGSDPGLGSYQVGDWIRVRANDGALQINDKYLRLIGIDVDIDENEVETTKLTVAEKYQMPKSVLDVVKDYERRLSALETVG